MPDHHRPGQDHVIIPIGTIKDATEDGISIRLIPPHPGDKKLQPQATILPRDSGTGTHARAKSGLWKPGATWPTWKSQSWKRSRSGRREQIPWQQGSPHIWPWRNHLTRPTEATATGDTDTPASSESTAAPQATVER